MNHSLTSAGLSQPQEPYPGLRPFLGHEASLLLGREDQITQIVDRLKSTHFVAVIGGSGSGKSSLIRAGVVPRLRAFGISDAGDYWIPVVYTPGTSKPVETQGPNQHLQTPVTRLAWKFARTLAPQNSDEETQALCDEIATVFRQGAGFTRLVRAYHDLLPAHGPRSDKARFLFVLDQFEELFHPNNRNSEDARLVIEAVIDHFADPDSRCFVVMTMRSEHLADCAAYLQLPDAINRSFYLVRRLKRNELRDVIMGPAHVFLRLQQRAGSTQLQEVVFAPEVVRRLIADVERIEDDPDHLPLLQHLLARLWQMAKERQGLRALADIPSSITWEDLAHACDPSRQAGPDWWRSNEQSNTLRLCLENWAQHTYLQRSPEDRIQVDQALRHLAFKDPNNGQYFQERINVDDPKVLPGVSAPKEELLRLLEKGFIDSVNYLFWDNENPAMTTLKVSHESFIRGWPHFRQLIDVEAERFDEFVTVLRRCMDWVAGGQRKSQLLEAADLERLDTRTLTPVFHDPEGLADWFDVLRQSRDGERLARTQPHVEAFVRSSQEHLAEAERAKKEKEDRIKEAEEFRRKTVEEQNERDRQAAFTRLANEARDRQQEAENARKDAELSSVKLVKRVLFLSLGAALLVLVVAAVNDAFTRVVKDPAFNSIHFFSQAQIRANHRPHSNGSPDLTASMEELQELLAAAHDTQTARQAFPILFQSPTDASTSLTVARAGQWIQFLLHTGWHERMVRDVSSEGVVNMALRELLTSAIWSSTKTPQGGPSAAETGKDTCEVSHGEAQLPDLLKQARTKWTDGKLEASSPSQQLGIWIKSADKDRGLFIPNKVSKNDPIRLLQASEVDGRCKAKDTVNVFPSSRWRMVLLLDDHLSRLALAQLGDDGQPFTDVFRIDWKWLPANPPSKSKSVLQIIPIRRLNEMTSALMPFMEVAGDDGPSRPLIPEVKVLKTEAALGGHDVAAAGKTWRLLANKALPVNTGSWSDNWSPLETPGSKTVCEGIGAQKSSTQDGSPGDMPSQAWVSRTLGACIKVARPADRGQVHLQVPVIVSVYDIPLSDKPTENPSTHRRGYTPSADWVFDTQPMGQANKWWIGKPGTKYQGWLAASPPNEGNSPQKAKAAPYSTGALIKLGCDIWQTADPAFKPKNSDADLKDICPAEAAPQNAEPPHARQLAAAARP